MPLPEEERDRRGLPGECDVDTEEEVEIAGLRGKVNSPNMLFGDPPQLFTKSWAMPALPCRPQIRSISQPPENSEGIGVPWTGCPLVTSNVPLYSTLVMESCPEPEPRSETWLSRAVVPSATGFSFESLSMFFAPDRPAPAIRKAASPPGSVSVLIRQTRAHRRISVG